MTKHPLFAEYVEACNYPGTINEDAVQLALREYLSALGIKRNVVRLRRGWNLQDHPPLRRAVVAILDDFAKRVKGACLDTGDARDARDARAALDALDALDARAARAALAALDARNELGAQEHALHRFAQWCIQSWDGWYYNWELSRLSLSAFGAHERKSGEVGRWAEPVLKAFLNGCWLLYWTDDTLYWAAKPSLHVETNNGIKRLHDDNGPAVESDVEDLYFIHGVLVPDFVVLYPERITIDHIRNEQNAEVRRIMIERMGWDRFCKGAKLKVIHTDTLTSYFPALPVSEAVYGDMRAVTSYRRGTETAELLESEEFKDFEDRPLKFVRVTDPSTGERYTLRAWPSNQRVYEAVAQTFNMTESEYRESVQRHS